MSDVLLFLSAHTPLFVKTVVIWPLMELMKSTVFSVGFPVALALTMITEALVPADDEQRLFSTGFWQDAIWFLYETVLRALVIVTYVNWLTIAYQRWFSSLTLQHASQWPALARMVLGFLLLDFLYWLQHYVNHKSRLLWQFHAVHHSQEQLNFFTDFRYHVVEYLVRNTILVIPFLILGFQAPTIIVISQVLQWYTRFYHGNIRTNLGPLRFILVTPQSHRVHHSRMVEHYDMNFGSILSIWDRLFGTAVHEHDIYPPTGIPDRAFPLERKASLPSLLVRPAVQLAYPFITIARWVMHPGSRERDARASATPIDSKAVAVPEVTTH